MTIVRLILLAASVILLMLLSIAWFTSADVAENKFYVTFIFLMTNILYIGLSSPKYNSSEIFDHVATWLALASLELRHRSNEAKNREVEVEHILSIDPEFNANKRQIAQEFMKYIRNNPAIEKHFDVEIKQISLPIKASRIELTTLAQSRSL